MIKVGIIGLGIMGGSFSLELQKTKESFYFIGLDHNKLHCAQAIELNIVNEIVNTLDELNDCDIIILTIPVDGIISISKQLKNIDPKCTIIDFGSTKEKISNSIPEEIRENFITAHPMTGTEKFGPLSAISDLYNKKVIVLCDLERSGLHQQKVAKNLFVNLGMELVFMNSKEHDRHSSFISHMPHAISYALANSVIKQEDSTNIVPLAAGGFKDMSRIAKSSPNMWEDIFKQNKENVVDAINSFQEELENCKNMIEEENWEELNKWMNKANTLHDILE